MPSPDNTDLPDTLPATPAGELFGVRSALTRDLLHLRHEINAIQDRIAFAQYGDPSKLGADRGRIAFAGRMLNEVGCTIADLTFLPSDDEAE